MYYKKIKEGDTTIEFHNNWMGVETVIVAGQIVSQKSSIMGTHHHFTVMENGNAQRYVLTTRIAGMGVVVDLRRNGVMVQQDIPISMGNKPQNKYKKTALIKLAEYDLEEAISDFEKALDFDSQDSEIYFHMACAYSVLELTKKAFECIQKSVELGLPDNEMILNHSMLAFVRMHPSFEAFHDSGFTQYNLE